MKALENNVLQALAKGEPYLWINPSMSDGLSSIRKIRFGMSDISDAEKRLQKFAPLLEKLFPELSSSNGIIESELLAVPAMQALSSSESTEHREVGCEMGKLWIKTDHNLPVAGSVKARGGIYEILCFAEELALEKGLVCETGDYSVLANTEMRDIFERYTISAGSTGNLGLSIGIISAALGFKVCMHMSVEAKEWKKSRLRDIGVTVIEHTQDYSTAVSAGRDAAALDSYAYFVDDENSERLFLGYSVAALRLKRQLRASNIQVDEDHPLFVYLPCGVGGAPGGITFGLKQVFGRAVHCFFAEPTQAPCMLLGMATDFQDNLSVYDVGLQINTEADGLAVGQASKLVGQIMKPILSGIFTVTDDQLFRDLFRLKHSEGIEIEPSAAAGFGGPDFICNSPEGQAYLRHKNLENCMAMANHIVWTTGGRLVPEEDYHQFKKRGEELFNVLTS